MVISCTAAILNSIQQQSPPQSVLYTVSGANVAKVAVAWYRIGVVVFDFGVNTPPTEAQLLLVYPGAFKVDTITTP